jgi:hypothetical protein
MMENDSVVKNAHKASEYWFQTPTLRALGNGHIHHTFLLTNEGLQGQFVLQRVSEAVFFEPMLVHEQTLRIIQHLSVDHDFCSRYRVPKLHPRINGELYLNVDSGFWRVWEYIDNTQVLESLADVNQISLSARAFADYQRVLATLPGPKLNETIAGFLQLDRYLQAFAPVAAVAPQKLQAVLKNLEDQRFRFAECNAHVHADCKVNNLLFNAQGNRVSAVIDLDTTMYGHWAWDFGDLTRSVALNRGHVDMQDYKYACEGFIVGLQMPLSQQMLEDMIDAPGHLAGMLGLRFLIDHLKGDIYFRVGNRGENLLRAEQQFALMQQFNDSQSQMRDVLQALV